MTPKEYKAKRKFKAVEPYPDRYVLAKDFFNAEVIFMIRWSDGTFRITNGENSSFFMSKKDGLFFLLEKNPSSELIEEISFKTSLDGMMCFHKFYKD